MCVVEKITAILACCLTQSVASQSEGSWTGLFKLLSEYVHRFKVFLIDKHIAKSHNRHRPSLSTSLKLFADTERTTSSLNLLFQVSVRLKLSSGGM